MRDTEELSALAAEAEMPLEQLMAQCGYMVPDGATLQGPAAGRMKEEAEQEPTGEIAAAGGKGALCNHDAALGPDQL